MTAAYSAGLWLPDSHSVRWEERTSTFVPYIRRRFYKATDTTEQVCAHIGGVSQQATAHALAEQMFRKEMGTWSTFHHRPM